MKKKIVGTFICIMLIATVIVISEDTRVEASGEEGDGEDVGLNFTYIQDITEMLSEIIDIIYDEESGEPAKGRAFGTAGEHYAAMNIIKPEMIAMGLDNPGLDPPYLERITNVSGTDPVIKNISRGNGNLTTKLQISARELIVNNSGEISTVDCYISPRWNESIDDNNYSKNLTHNFSYSGLKIINANNYTCTDDFLQYVSLYFSDCGWVDLIKENAEILNEVLDVWFFGFYNNLTGSMEEEFQEYYNFTFSTIDPDNPSTFPNFLEPIENVSDGFVFIEENPKFHPYIQELPSLEDSDSYNELYPWTLIVRRTYDNLRMKAWHKTYPNCKGLLYYDYDNYSYDTGFKGTYLPIICINGSVGEQINSSVENHTIDFYIDQYWNESIESYNVIGQINGKDTSKTVLIESLYDSVWSQGTVDSAIGIGIMLAIAKYFKENNITPKYNLRFIAFGGEEYGVIGAMHYDVTHRDNDDENIITVIDLNQLGYSQTYPQSTLNIATNRKPLEIYLNKISDITNYVDRVEDSTDLETYKQSMDLLHKKTKDSNVVGYA